MGGEPIWRECRWPPNQALPENYVVGAEWGETRSGRIGVGCYYFVFGRDEVIGMPRRTRWEARRDALAHSRGEDVETWDW